MQSFMETKQNQYYETNKTILFKILLYNLGPFSRELDFKLLLMDFKHSSKFNIYSKADKKVNSLYINVKTFFTQRINRGRYR